MKLSIDFTVLGGNLSRKNSIITLTVPETLHSLRIEGFGIFLFYNIDENGVYDGRKRGSLRNFSEEFCYTTVHIILICQSQSKKTRIACTYSFFLIRAQGGSVDEIWNELYWRGEKYCLVIF